MNRLLLSLFLSLICSSASAQMDERFYFPSKGLEIPDSLTHEVVRIPVAGGDTLYNAFFPARDKARGSVLLIHGAGGNIARYLFMMQPLVAAGYQVYMVDFRGYGLSSGKPTHQNIATDAPLVFESFRQYKTAKGLPLIIFGASMGTQIAAKMAHDHASQVDALILDGGFTGINDLAAAHVPDSMRAMVKMMLKPPYAATESVKTLTGLPKLFIHSKADKDVPYELGEALYNAAAGPKELLVYPGAHIMLMHDNPAAVISWLDKATGGKE